MANVRKTCSTKVLSQHAFSFLPFPFPLWHVTQLALHNQLIYTRTYAVVGQKQEHFPIVQRDSWKSCEPVLCRPL